MTQSRSALVLLVALVLSVSFVVPAEDVPETGGYILVWRQVKENVYETT